MAITSPGVIIRQVALQTKRLWITTEEEPHHGTQGHPSGRTSGRGARGARHERRRTRTSVERTDESRHGDPERATRSFRGHRVTSGSLLRNDSTILAELQSLYELRLAEAKSGK